MAWFGGEGPGNWMSVARWARHGPTPDAPGRFAYHRTQKRPVVAFVVFSAVETVVLHAVLLAIFGSTWWVWAIVVLGAYTPVWILGRFYASMALLPHEVGDAVVTFRAGNAGALRVPRHAIRRVAGGREGHAGRPGQFVLERSGPGGTYRGLLTNGPGNVTVHLDPDATITFRDAPVSRPISILHVTADRPRGLVAALDPRVETVA